MLQSLHQQTGTNMRAHPSYTQAHNHTHTSSRSHKNMHIHKYKVTHMLTHPEFIFTKYALKVECCSFNCTLWWPPTEVWGCEISQLAPLNENSEIIWQNFSSKTYLMVFKFADGRECESERQWERESRGVDGGREEHMAVEEILYAACIKH